MQCKYECVETRASNEIVYTKVYQKLLGGECSFNEGVYKNVSVTSASVGWDL